MKESTREIIELLVDRLIEMKGRFDMLVVQRPDNRAAPMTADEVERFDAESWRDIAIIMSEHIKRDLFTIFRDGHETACSETGVEEGWDECAAKERLMQCVERVKELQSQKKNKG